MEKKREELRRLNGVYSGILDRANVEIIEGRAIVVDPHTVEVNGKQYTSKYICVAVGGTPSLLNLPGTLFSRVLACADNVSSDML